MQDPYFLTAEYLNSTFRATLVPFLQQVLGSRSSNPVTHFTKLLRSKKLGTGTVKYCKNDEFLKNETQNNTSEKRHRECMLPSLGLYSLYSPSELLLENTFNNLMGKASSVHIFVDEKKDSQNEFMSIEKLLAKVGFKILNPVFYESECDFCIPSPNTCANTTRSPVVTVHFIAPTFSRFLATYDFVDRAVKNIFSFSCCSIDSCINTGSLQPALVILFQNGNEMDWKHFTSLVAFALIPPVESNCQIVAKNAEELRKRHRLELYSLNILKYDQERWARRAERDARRRAVLERDGSFSEGDNQNYEHLAQLRAKRRRDGDFLISRLMTMDHAMKATRLQALARGFLTRRKIRKLRKLLPDSDVFSDCCKSVKDQPSLLPHLPKLVAITLTALETDFNDNLTILKSYHVNNIKPWCSRQFLIPHSRHISHCDTDFSTEEDEVDVIEIASAPLSEIMPPTRINPFERLVEVYKVVDCEIWSLAQEISFSYKGLSRLQRKLHRLIRCISLDLLFIAFVELRNRRISGFDGSFSNFVLNRFSKVLSALFSPPLELPVSFIFPFQSMSHLATRVLYLGSCGCTPCKGEGLVSRPWSTAVPRRVVAVADLAPCFVVQAQLDAVNAEKDKIIWISVTPDPAVYLNGYPAIALRRPEMQRLAEFKMFDDFSNVLINCNNEADLSSFDQFSFQETFASDIQSIFQSQQSYFDLPIIEIEDQLSKRVTYGTPVFVKEVELNISLAAEGSLRKESAAEIIRESPHYDVSRHALSVIKVPFMPPFLSSFEHSQSQKVDSLHLQTSFASSRSLRSTTRCNSSISSHPRDGLFNSEANLSQNCFTTPESEYQSFSEGHSISVLKPADFYTEILSCNNSRFVRLPAPPGFFLQFWEHLQSLISLTEEAQEATVILGLPPRGELYFLVASISAHVRIRNSQIDKQLENSDFSEMLKCGFDLSLHVLDDEIVNSFLHSRQLDLDTCVHAAVASARLTTAASLDQSVQRLTEEAKKINLFKLLKEFSSAYGDELRTHEKDAKEALNWQERLKINIFKHFRNKLDISLLSFNPEANLSKRFTDKFLTAAGLAEFEAWIIRHAFLEFLFRNHCFTLLLQEMLKSDTVRNKEETKIQSDFHAMQLSFCILFLVYIYIRKLRSSKLRDSTRRLSDYVKEDSLKPVMQLIYDNQVESNCCCNLICRSCECSPAFTSFCL